MSDKDGIPGDIEWRGPCPECEAALSLETLEAIVDTSLPNHPPTGQAIVICPFCGFRFDPEENLRDRRDGA